MGEQAQGHTPGPWVAVEGFNGPVVEGGRSVVAMLGTLTVASEAEAEANARLIASAPDLLAACEAVEALIGDVSDAGLWPTLGPVADRLREAILRAKGEPIGFGQYGERP